MHRFDAHIPCGSILSPSLAALQLSWASRQRLYVFDNSSFMIIKRPPLVSLSHTHTCPCEKGGYQSQRLMIWVLFFICKTHWNFPVKETQFRIPLFFHGYCTYSTQRGPMVLQVDFTLDSLSPLLSLDGPDQRQLPNKRMSTIQILVHA